MTEKPTLDELREKSDTVSELMMVEMENLLVERKINLATATEFAAKFLFWCHTQLTMSNGGNLAFHRILDRVWNREWDRLEERTRDGS